MIHHKCIYLAVFVQILYDCKWYIVKQHERTRYSCKNDLPLTIQIVAATGLTFIGMLAVDFCIHIKYKLRSFSSFSISTSKTHTSIKTKIGGSLGPDWTSCIYCTCNSYLTQTSSIM